MEYNYIELNSYQVTAYFWINQIRSKVKEIFYYGYSDEKEENFFSIFSEFDEKKWRKLFLSLTEYVEKDVLSYVLKENYEGVNAFSQDTCLSGHKRLNKELSLILNKRIPDVRLASNDLKDSIVYTKSDSVIVWYKSCGTRVLDSKYNPTYVITGDEEKLKLYNTLLFTINSLKYISNDFHSLYILRKVFCSSYANDNNLEIDYVLDIFNETINLLDDNGLINGRSFGSNYFVSYSSLDLVGLDDYVETSEKYADLVIKEYRGNSRKMSME